MKHKNILGKKMLYLVTYLKVFPYHIFKYFQNVKKYAMIRRDLNDEEEHVRNMYNMAIDLEVINQTYKNYTEKTGQKG